MDNRRPDGPCTSPEHRQFDFWLGDWEVRDPEGTVVGRNRITSVFDGWALREEWRGTSGHRGTSLSAWSPQRRKWHQTWVDSLGLLLLIDGEMRDGAMVMEGEAASPTDQAALVRHRLSWSIMDGDRDRVRQHWQISGDGESWATVFDGRYVRLNDAAEAGT